jgi:hypothetical protein
MQLSHDPLWTHASFDDPNLVSRMRRLGAGPVWLRLPGGQVRVRRAALDAWLRDRRNDSDQREEEDAA